MKNIALALVLLTSFFVAPAFAASHKSACCVKSQASCCKGASGCCKSSCCK